MKMRSSEKAFSLGRQVIKTRCFDVFFLWLILHNIFDIFKLKSKAMCPEIFVMRSDINEALFDQNWKFVSIERFVAQYWMWLPTVNQTDYFEINHVSLSHAFLSWLVHLQIYSNAVRYMGIKNDQVFPAFRCIFFGVVEGECNLTKNQLS